MTPLHNENKTNSFKLFCRQIDSNNITNLGTQTPIHKITKNLREHDKFWLITFFTHWTDTYSTGDWRTFLAVHDIDSHSFRNTNWDSKRFQLVTTGWYNDKSCESDTNKYATVQTVLFKFRKRRNKAGKHPRRRLRNWQWELWKMIW